ncbi:hypothetical protein BV898_11303 [Hypsibius exemplaris]|uniref:Uncharacterized protein n=1 Tax=Hypsibius exemplaris TaxID=2072580 RepID=A0A1W0WGY2_HYPEX|nr:hypothetical protein BV898_11303 [Hypsibius exemplaris]
MERKPKYKRFGRLQRRLLQALQTAKSPRKQLLIASSKQVNLTLPSEEDYPANLDAEYDQLPFPHVDPNFLRDSLNDQQNPPKRTGLFAGERRNRMGWKVTEVGALILYTAKKAGVADTTLGKFLQIIALMVNTPRHPLDQRPVPNTVHKLKSLLRINPKSHQELVYICPNRPPAPRRAGTLNKAEDRCGYRMRATANPVIFECPLCKISYDKKVLDKDGNHFITVPLRAILTDTMARFGKYVSLNDNRELGETGMNDVVDGKRFRDMQLAREDLAILKHYDGGVFSKSTQKKLYLSFV